MKKAFGLLLLAAAMTLAFTTAVETVKVDTTKSTVAWKAYKVTGEHSGTVNIKNGELMMEGGALVGGSFEMDMGTILVTDLKGKMKERLEGHLNSPDFFSVEEFPSASFKITKVAPRGTPGDYKVVGDLTIKGITKEVKFNTSVKEEEGAMVATAAIQVDRSDFNVRYGSGSFFENLGDKTIYDEFDLTVTLVSAN
ncbi:MAG: YceI family protein [Bacteroidota bacterium]